MFSRYSVKKPLTVVLAALMVVLLGGDLFHQDAHRPAPRDGPPYVAVVTVYAGASPEKVETGVTSRWKAPCPPSAAAYIRSPVSHRRTPAW